MIVGTCCYSHPIYTWEYSSKPGQTYCTLVHPTVERSNELHLKIVRKYVSHFLTRSAENLRRLSWYVHQLSSTGHLSWDYFWIRLWLSWWALFTKVWVSIQVPVPLQHSDYFLLPLSYTYRIVIFIMIFLKKLGKWIFNGRYDQKVLLILSRK